MVDVIADVVKFRDSLFGEAESRQAYRFAAGLDEGSGPEPINTARNGPERPDAPAEQGLAGLGSPWNDRLCRG